MSEEQKVLRSINDCKKVDGEDNCWIVPDNFTIVQYLEMAKCSKLAKTGILVIPETVKSISSFCTYAGIVGIYKLVVGCEKIQDWAFSNALVENIVLLNSVREIGAYAFNYCNCKEINIPGSVKKIGDGAFNCCLLKEVVLHKGVEKIGSKAFYNNPIFTLVLPASLEKIAEDAFGDLSGAEIHVKRGSFAEKFMLQHKYKVIYKDEVSNTFVSALLSVLRKNVAPVPPIFSEVKIL